MFHAILPVLDQIRLEQKIIFCSNTVRKASAITNRDLLIPLLISYCILPFKRENGAQGNVQVR